MTSIYFHISVYLKEALMPCFSVGRNYFFPVYAEWDQFRKKETRLQRAKFASHVIWTQIFREKNFCNCRERCAGNSNICCCKQHHRINRSEPKHVDPSSINRRLDYIISLVLVCAGKCFPEGSFALFTRISISASFILFCISRLTKW